MTYPAWMAHLTVQDRGRLAAQLERAPHTKQTEVRKDWQQRVEDPAYLAFKSVRSGSPLKPRDIVLPNIPTADDRPLDGFMAEYLADDYATRGQFYQRQQEDRIKTWEETVRAYEKEPNNFYNAWYYLDAHPAFWRFSGDNGMTPPEERINEWGLCDEYGIHAAVDMRLAKVNPATGRHEDDLPNTLTEVWLELGKTNWPGPPDQGDYIRKGEVYPRDYSCHDPKLDCGGLTMEEAIIAAAVNVHTHYGNDRRICDAEPNSVSGNG